MSTRPSIISSSCVILTNIDTLHHYLLPSADDRVVNFLANVKYIVVDEAHYYRENKIHNPFAAVMNRLRLKCIEHQPPVFIATSATMGSDDLIPGVNFNVIDVDSSGSGRKTYYVTRSLVNPKTDTQYSPVVTVAKGEPLHGITKLKSLHLCLTTRATIAPLAQLA